MKFYPEIDPSTRNIFIGKMREIITDLSIEYGVHIDWDLSRSKKCEEVWFVIKTQDTSYRFDTLEELKSALKNKVFL